MKTVWAVLIVLACGCEDIERSYRKAGGNTDTATKTAPVMAPTATPPPISSADRRLLKIVAGNMSTEEIVELINEAKDNKAITYAHLKKNAEKYKGKPWRTIGRLVEVAEVDGETRARLNTSPSGENIIYVVGKFETDFVEDNVVEVVGVLSGTFEYKSQAGWDLSIPALIMAAMTKRGGLDKLAREK